jgi:O-succinylbenzoate synthase
MIGAIDCRIKALIIEEYEVSFKTPLRIGKKTLKTRKGLVTTLIDEEGLSGYGEIAPLEGFSKETLAQAGAQARRLAGRLPGMALIRDFCLQCVDYTKMIPGLKTYPSVAFGLETAAVNLMQNRFRKAMPGAGASRTVRKIPVNALLTGPGPGQSLEEAVQEILANGFKTIKIKVGRDPVDMDLQRFHQVAGILPADVQLRLDANRLWDFPTAVTFGKGIAAYKAFVEYIEEPFVYENFGQLEEFSQETGIPFALDESLQGVVPGEFPVPEGLAALVIKPTMLGGFQRIMEFIDLAREYRLKPVISSCFEVGPGFAELLKIAANIDFDQSASGLDTLRYVQQDFFAKPVVIEQGSISLELPAEHFTFASGGQGALFKKTAPWTPAKIFD